MGMMKRRNVEFELVGYLRVGGQRAHSYHHLNRPLTRTRSSRSTGVIRVNQYPPILLVKDNLTSLVTVIRDLFDHQKAFNGYQDVQGP